MKKPPKNETLEQIAIRLENTRHANRLRAIKEMSSKLRLLQPFVEPLNAKGVDIYPSEINTFWRSKPLRGVIGYGHLSGSRRPQQAVDALLELGFKEIARKVGALDTDYTLAKGHLQLFVSVPHPRAGVPSSAAQPATAPADQAVTTTEGKPA